ncbi:hypothetical protein [Pedobacter heparinus]|uniref:hypothetical protein n=1 Tax=Pedobacter heparinus TaxID=984 RepID=UPI002930FA58|nr:hypothetical protein [Pedobacter heparinus]
MQQIGTGNAVALLSELEYSETGQRLHKQLHGNLQDISYSDTGKTYIIHIEWQSEDDAAMDNRMLGYRATRLE